MNANYKISIDSGSEARAPGSHDTDQFYRFSDWLRHHAILASLIILLSSLSARLFFTLHTEPNRLIFPDSPTYITPALSIMESGSFLNRQNTPEISRTPGYPFVLAALIYAVGNDFRNLAITQTIIVSFSVLILYWFARQILPPVMAFTGSLLAAFSPWGAVRAGFLLTEGVFLLVLALLFFVMYLVVERAKKLPAFLFGGGLVGLLTSAAVLVRPVWTLVPLIAIVVFLLCGDKRQKAWVLVAVLLVCASTPLYLWKIRNLNEAHFDGLTDISGKAAWTWLAASVEARVKGNNSDRWAMVKAHESEEYKWGGFSHQWGSSRQEANDKRWRMAKAVFQEHPFLTIYSFGANAAEPLVHPDPGILTPAALRFTGDLFVLGAIWAALLIFAWLGLDYGPDVKRDDGVIRRNWLIAILSICLLLTVTSGVAFGAGSRYRAPLELIVPLLAGVGVVRIINHFHI